MHECLPDCTCSKCSKSKFRNRNLRQRYGITDEVFQTMLLGQNNKCKICSVHNSTKPLCVDHSHTTNSVRGLLCGTCNKGLGRFKDDVKLLTLAIEYLTKAKG